MIENDRIASAYSGGLDTSVQPFSAGRSASAEIVAVTMDL